MMETSSTNDPERPTTVVPAPGKQLREAREARKLTVDEVAQQLRLDPRQVTALENDDYECLPEPIYVSGFLRNYARLLHMAEEEVVAAYRRLDVPTPPILSELAKHNRVQPSRDQTLIQWGAVCLVVVGLILLGWHMSAKVPSPGANHADVPPPTAQAPTPATPPATGAVNAAAAAGEAAPVQESPQSNAAPAAGAKPVHKDTTQRPAVADEVSQPPATSASEPVPLAATTAVPAASQVPAAPVATLKFHFDDASWVEVTDATGERVFYDLGEAGQTRVVQGSPPFKVLLGYSPGVSIEYNGVPFDQSSHTGHNNVARFTVGG